MISTELRPSSDISWMTPTYAALLANNGLTEIGGQIVPIDTQPPSVGNNDPSPLAPNLHYIGTVPRAGRHRAAEPAEEPPRPAIGRHPVTWPRYNSHRQQQGSRPLERVPGQANDRHPVPVDTRYAAYQNLRPEEPLNKHRAPRTAWHPAETPRPSPLSSAADAIGPLPSNIHTEERNGQLYLVEYEPMSTTRRLGRLATFRSAKPQQVREVPIKLEDPDSIRMARHMAGILTENRAEDSDTYRGKRHFKEASAELRQRSRDSFFQHPEYAKRHSGRLTKRIIGGLGIAAVGSSIGYGIGMVMNSGKIEAAQRLVESWLN